MIRIENLILHRGPVASAASRPLAGVLSSIHPILQIRQLSIRFGEFVSVVGPNGAGKSTFLHLLAGLQVPTSGSIVFDSPNALPATQSRTPSSSLVFQSPDDQIVGSTVRRDLAFGLECEGAAPPEIRSRVDEAVRSSGLASQENRPPHLLSEGEKQRLALASALIVRPGLLLLDEPTSRLDPGARRSFLDRLDKERRAGTSTIIQVTHRSEEFMSADRLLGFDAGGLEFDGPPRDFLALSRADRFRPLWSPLHRFRRRLLEAGLVLEDPPAGRWNDVGPLLADLVMR